MTALPPALVLSAYAQGAFPMGESRDDPEVVWLSPRERGIFPIEKSGLHLSRSLRRQMRQGGFSVSLNRATAEVIDACADREKTWINPLIRESYLALARIGHVHSLEIWDGAALIGGTYGVSLGAAFCGESMFSRATGGSKLALAWLLDHLRHSGFRVMDTQFLTPHLASLGAVEIPRAAYLARLRDALDAPPGQFGKAPLPDAETLIARNNAPLAL